MRPYFCQKVLLCYAEHYPYRWVACCDLALRGYISVQKGEESRKKERKEQRFHYRLVRMCMPDHAGPFLGKTSAGRLTTTLAYIEKRRLQTIWHPRRCAMQFREAARRTKNEAFGFEMIRASFLLNQPAAHPCSRHMTPAPAAIGMSRNRTLAAALRFRSPRKALRGLSI